MPRSSQPTRGVFSTTGWLQTVIARNYTQNGFLVATDFALSRDSLKRGVPTNDLTVDVAVLSKKFIGFIKIEPHLWVQNALAYLGLAHKVYVAFPEEAPASGSTEQKELAES